MHEQFVGTKPVDERHRFDIPGLERYLRDRIDGFSGPLEVEQFSGGQSNPTYLLKAGSGNYVLRRKPPGKRRWQKPRDCKPNAKPQRI